MNEKLLAQFELEEDMWWLVDPEDEDENEDQESGEGDEAFEMPEPTGEGDPRPPTITSG